MTSNYTDFIKDKESKREDKDNIYCTGISDEEFIYFTIKYLLGDDWYVVDPLGPKQVNTNIVHEVLWKYSKKYRKEYKQYRKQKLRERDWNSHIQWPSWNWRKRTRPDGVCDGCNPGSQGERVVQNRLWCRIVLQAPKPHDHAVSEIRV